MGDPYSGKGRGGAEEAAVSDVRLAGALVASVDDELERLAKLALQLIDGHWEFVRTTERAKTDWNDKSRLQVRLRQYEGGAFALEWTEVRWGGSKAKGNRQRIFGYIPTLKDSYGYSNAKLQRLARDWEVAAVLQLEKKLAAIRKTASYLHKAKANLGYANTAFLALERMEVQENG